MRSYPGRAEVQSFVPPPAWRRAHEPARIDRREVLTLLAGTPNGSDSYARYLRPTHDGVSPDTGSSRCGSIHQPMEAPGAFGPDPDLGQGVDLGGQGRRRRTPASAGIELRVCRGVGRSIGSE